MSSLCLFLLISTPQAPELHRPELKSQLAQTIHLLRDSHGVAHVFASTDAGAYFGAGYAAAEDRLFQMCWGRLMYQGRVAEFFGAGPQVAPGKFQNIEHDRKARLFGWKRHAQKTVAAVDPEVRALLQAYADGVNAYVNAPGAVIHPFFAQYWVPLDPWTPEDCVGLWIRLARHFGSDPTGKAAGLHEFEDLVAQFGHDVAVDMMTPDLVYDDSAAAVAQSDVPAAVQQAMHDYAASWGYGLSFPTPSWQATPHFSHAWAVGAVKTTTGRAVLHSDPQTSIHVPSTFYEWHMKGRTFEVRGVGAAGSPNVLIGSSNYNAWGATALGMDQADLFRLIVDPVNRPGEYQLDGVWYPWDFATTETILVKNGTPVLEPYRETYWGPVVTAIVPDADPGEEYAAKMVPLADPGSDAAEGYLALYRARTIESFGAALAGVPFPSFNAVFANADGRVGYWANGLAPLRSTRSPLGGNIAQDGGFTHFDWLDIVPHDLMPWVIAPAVGFVLTGNHMPVGAWYPIPVVFGTGSLGDTSRSRRLRERLSAPPGFTPGDVLAVHHDSVQPARRDVALLGLFLRDVQGYPLSLGAQRALSELEPWLNAGGSMTDAHRGVVVAHFLNLQFRKDQVPTLVPIYGASENGLHNFLKQKIAGIQQAPPLPLASDEAAWINTILAGAWSLANGAPGDPGNWIHWYNASVLTVSRPKWTSLEGFPALAPGVSYTAGPLTCTDGGTILSQLNQSYSQDWEVGVVDGAIAVLPFGVSEHDGSSHQLDQKPLWEAESFKSSPTTRPGIAAMGAYTVTVLTY
ncbi:MAG: penicillin acylase family protein [Planctomycetota bacterium]|nr:MAG: penicillin acylase family protein [Planctomycetota bacterium]